MDQHGLCSIYTVKKLGNLQTAASWQELHISISNHSDQQSSWSTTAYINSLPFQPFHLTRTARSPYWGRLFFSALKNQDAAGTWSCPKLMNYRSLLGLLLDCCPHVFSLVDLRKTTTKGTGNNICANHRHKKKGTTTMPYQCGIHILIWIFPKKTEYSGWKPIAYQHSHYRWEC